MSDARMCHVHYDVHLLERAQAGRHNFTNRLRSALARRGVTLDLRRDSAAETAMALTRPGFTLLHMAPPVGPRMLTLRRAYLAPFWRIEASARRWEFAVAVARFDPDAVDGAAAALFHRRRCNADLPGAMGAVRGDLVYVPLQGRLLDHRSFQTMSPIEMLGETLAHSGTRAVVATPHPGEVYSEAERGALDALAAANPRLTIRTGGLHDLLRDCAYVVTQNSSVALLGYFYAKPAILFGQVDFHHIARNVAHIGVAEAFRGIGDHRPDHVRYLHWFLKETAINAGSDTAEDQILAAMQRGGWVF